MNETLEQCVQRHKKHSMIIHRDKFEESEFQINVYATVILSDGIQKAIFNWAVKFEILQVLCNLLYY